MVDRGREDHPALHHAHLAAVASSHRIAAAWARALEARSLAARHEAPGSFGPATEALFDLVAESELLPRLAPRGRVPRDFAERALRTARSRARILRIEREVLGIAKRAARRSGREGPQSIELRRGGALIGRLAGLAARHPGEPEEGVAPGELPLPGTRLIVDARGRVRSRATIAGSEIVLGPPLRSTASGLRVDRAGGRSSGGPLGTRDDAPQRLARALAIVDAAWPEAGAEIRERTRLVLPLYEPGVVSFSLASRPGVSFINLRGKSLVDLADDLLHESAHHKLHAIERRTPLFRGSPDEQPRLWSPWRRAMRPVRGLVHACFTFAFRAELLDRIARASGETRMRAGAAHLRLTAENARRLNREARSERRSIVRALDALAEPEARAWITPEGSELLGAIRRAVRRAPRGEDRVFPLLARASVVGSRGQV